MTTTSTALNDIFKATLSENEFKRLSTYIFTEYGIKMPPVKKIMLQSRLQKRLRELQMNNFKDYVEFVFSEEGQANEVIHMIDVVSTNKTDFFREPIHFDFLKSVILPEIDATQTAVRPVKIWSAGCSSGEEPYTIAMTMAEFQEKYPEIDYQILATDISSRILKTALEAIYKESRAELIPMSLKKKYLLKSKDRVNPSVRIVPELRKKVTFQRLNFMEHSYNVSETFDVIFCRNVLIYFDRETQEKVINRLCTKLKPGGYFFLGHSESITNINVPLRQIRPTIFQRI
ncbi:MAG TPA: protein-glutamate O-methyltransferase [Bacteroidales bacterium]|nr:protein-glutamate O-methyltransferase [Bacteroidales bacterium]